MKIGFVGCGNVGSASAYACVLRGVGTELVLVDYNEALARAQAEDIAHATPFAKAMTVRHGTYDDLEHAAVILISAGVNQKPGETRLDLLKRNTAIFEGIIPSVLRVAPQAVLLVATNPVDIMTHIVAQIAATHGHPPEKVIGSGTILDTARFRTLLARHLDVSSHSVHAHVLGEHGDSEVLHWSGAVISTMPLDSFAQQTGRLLTPPIRTAIDDAVRNAAYHIIAGKGATWYGIGAGMARLAQTILDDEQAVLTCCTRHSEVAGVSDVTLSLPHVVAAQGIVRPTGGGVVLPVLAPDEAQALQRSASRIKEATTSIGY